MGRSFNRGLSDEEKDIKERMLNRLEAENHGKSYEVLRLSKLLLTDELDRYGRPTIGFTLFNTETGEPENIIVVNRYLTLDSMYVVVRHEILHNILSHMLREMEILNNMEFTNPDGTAKLLF